MKTVCVLLVLAAGLAFIFPLEAVRAQVETGPAVDDSEPEVFYFGWRGRRVPLKLSTERIGITFRERVNV